MPFTKKPANLFFSGLSLLFVITALIGSPLSSKAQNLTLKNLPPTGTFAKYRHWNTEKKKVTGFNTVTYKLISHEGNKYIFQLEQYFKDDGAIFIEKRTLFHPTSRRLTRHEEMDFRSGLRLLDVIEGENIKTWVGDKEETREFERKNEPQLMLMEVSIPTLREKIPEMIQKKEFEFTIYLPLISFELKKKHFIPFNISELDMTATAEFLSLDSDAGKIPAVSVVVRPDSSIVRTFLPDNRKEFKFVFSAVPPYQFLILIDGHTQTILTEIKEPGKERKVLNIKPL